MGIGTRITNTKALSELRISTTVIDARTGTMFRISKREGEMVLVDRGRLHPVTGKVRLSRTSGRATLLSNFDLSNMDLSIVWEPPVKAQLKRITMNDIYAMIAD